ncbi:MAG: peroxiredoxin Q/BCP [Myxococcota bacterium]
MEAKMLARGATVAEFSLPDQEGTPVAWSSFRGRPVVVFFYPKANTPGCTTEACDFRDLASEFAAVGAAVIGISADSVRKQANWASKHSLGFPLLSDPAREVLEPWGVWGAKKLYGREYQGIHRTTVLFDAEGRVAEVWPKVKVKGHADAVMERVRALAAG